jgi:hypothetical protein
MTPTQATTQPHLFTGQQLYTYKGDIAFSQNWNGKFFCKYLTTIRLSNLSKYHVGSIYRLMLDGEFLVSAKIIDLRYCKVDELPEWTCLLDTTYDKKNTIAMFKAMYSAKNIDWNNQQLVLIMLENLDFINTSLKRKP